MATLTTKSGAVITFLPSKVDVVADHHDSTGEAVTCVYGIPPVMLTIDETVQEFMGRLRVEAHFAQLTRPNGWPVWIRASSVSAIRTPVPGEYPAAVKAVISTDSLTQAVRETLTEATSALNAHGGEL